MASSGFFDVKIRVHSWLPMKLRAYSARIELCPDTVRAVYLCGTVINTKACKITVQGEGDMLPLRLEKCEGNWWAQTSDRARIR